MDFDYFIRGIIFVLLGILFVCYVFYKRKKEKSYNDWKGLIGGFGLVIFGLYLIFGIIYRSILDKG